MASLQLPAKYPQLPAHLIGQIETSYGVYRGLCAGGIFDMSWSVGVLERYLAV